MTSSILFICRANLCRSPSAEVMLARALSLQPGADYATRSAGMEVMEGLAAPDDFVEIALVRGIDLRAHKPVAFDAALGRDADLILTMTRDLLRAMVVSAPDLWPRSFTLRELVRRGTTTTPPIRGEALVAWIARVHAGRDRAELLGSDLGDDLRDPMADGSDGNEAMFGELERATRQLARLLGALSG